MHHGRGHTPWTRTDTMGIDMHQEHVHAEWTWTWPIMGLANQVVITRKLKTMRNCSEKFRVELIRNGVFSLFAKYNYSFLSIVIIATFFAQVIIARQVGILHERSSLIRNRSR